MHCVLRLKAENTRVTSAYEEIEERYRPYRDQVDGLEELNHFLRNQTSSAQTEAQKLSDQYTKLLGHQNQKQKIHYVKKIKDENSGMRQVSPCASLVYFSMIDMLILFLYRKSASSKLKLHARNELLLVWRKKMLGPSLERKLRTSRAFRNL